MSEEHSVEDLYKKNYNLQAQWKSYVNKKHTRLNHHLLTTNHLLNNLLFF